MSSISLRKSLQSMYEGWLFTVLHNLWAGHIGKFIYGQIYTAHADETYHINLPQGVGMDCTCGNYGPGEIRQFVGLLPQEYRQPFAMHISGFSYSEIAKRSDLPLAVVKERIAFARQLLKPKI
ncbi:MAG: sigma factor-like helix-turn-helix DNA-binding protein [Bacteroidales bacterium]|nr:sigma factor-like helix-turn-helix DNA-binding protein [Bacteroidales bacterium]